MRLHQRRCTSRTHWAKRVSKSLFRIFLKIKVTTLYIIFLPLSQNPNLIFQFSDGSFLVFFLALDGKILVEDLVKLASEIEDAEADETDEPTTKS